MIETLPEQTTPAAMILPKDVVDAFSAFRGRLSARSQIVWGEHCSECAYPACYAHCAFYTPRADMNCRRFEGGFEPVVGLSDLHRIRFRKWGKLEGQGPGAMVPAAVAERRDRQDALWTTLIDRAPAPYWAKRTLAWRRNKAKGTQRGAAASAADAFAVETWARARQAFTLTILNTGAHSGALFQTRFDAGPGYRREMIPVAMIAAHVDFAAPFLVQIEPVGEAEGVEAVFGVCDFVALTDVLTEVLTGAPATAVLAPTEQKPAKVVVWDLDETLWTGVLAEDGVGGVTLLPKAAAAIKMLDDRGVLQSIASKNDHAEAMAALRAFGLADYFLHPQIHWRPKSGSIGAIARALDLGLDSLVFIDDQPFERAEVAATHPMVRTLAHTEVEALSSHPWFDLPVTPESRKRRVLYRQEAARTDAYQTDGGDYAGFLRASNLTLTVARLEEKDVERVYELSQRTNQLNFNGAKFSRTEVEALMRDPAKSAFVLRCADRFGDYGLIGFAVADLDGGVLADFFMSCRVQRKRVEHAFFAWLGGEMAARGARAVQVAFTATRRNGAAIEMLDTLGFTPGADGVRRRSAVEPIAEADIVAVSAPTSASPPRLKICA
jgi:FkbH-like protein